MKHTLKNSFVILLTSALLVLGGCAQTPTASTPNSTEESSSQAAPTSEAPAVTEPAGELKTITVGASPAPHAQILQAAGEELKTKGYELKVIEFTDYVLPNKALDNGEIDANFFQHKPYLDDFNLNNGTKLAAAAYIHFEPLGIYAGKSDSLENIKDGAEIAVPNDTSNEARALELLVKLGVIELAPNSDLTSTVKGITSNPKNVKILEIEAAQLPRTLPDVDFAIINGNYAIDAGITESLITTEDKSSTGAQKFANIIAVRQGDEETPASKALVEALQSEPVRKFIEESYNGLVIPVF